MVKFYSGIAVGVTLDKGFSHLFTNKDRLPKPVLKAVHVTELVVLYGLLGLV